MAYSRMVAIGGEYSLTFSCGDLPSDSAVVAAGHEPNGYFWEGIAVLIAPELVDRVEMDSEADTFKAIGLRADIEELRNKLESVIGRPATVRSLIAQAVSTGFEFGD